ncbi:MAG: hypothetical protein ACFFDE_05445 [Promethearchaeota archaeon]
MGGAAPPVLTASRLLNASRSPLAADDTDVTDYNKAYELIVVAQIDEEKGPWEAQYSLQWRDVTDEGSFADLAATGEIKWGTATDLQNGNAVVIGEKACTNTPSGSSWQDGEEVEGTAVCDSINLGDEYYTEIHFAVNPNDAEAGHEYEFQLYDSTNSAAIGVLLAGITIASAPFTPKQRNWRFYRDDAAEPSVALADEVTLASLPNAFIIRLRVNVAETGGDSGASNVSFKFEYSTNESDWYTPGPSAAWDYADGQATEGNTVTGLKLTDTDTQLEYVESSGGAGTGDIGAGQDTEWDLALKPTLDVLANTTYYFRILINDTPVPLDSGETHAQVSLPAGTAPYNIVTLNTVLDGYCDYWRTYTRSNGSLIHGVHVTNELIAARVAIALYADYKQNSVQASLDTAEDICTYINGLKNGTTKLWDNTDDTSYQSLINNVLCCLALYLVGVAASNTTLKDSATETVGKFFDATFPYNSETVGGWYPNEKDSSVEVYNQNLFAARAFKYIGDAESNTTWTNRAYDLVLRVEDQQDGNGRWPYQAGGAYRHQYQSVMCQLMAWAALEWSSDTSLLTCAEDTLSGFEGKQDETADYDGWVDSYDSGGNPTDTFYARVLVNLVGYYFLVYGDDSTLEGYNYDKATLTNVLRRYDATNGGLEYEKATIFPRNDEYLSVVFWNCYELGVLDKFTTKGTTDFAFEKSDADSIHAIDSAADWDEGTTITDVKTAPNHSGKLVLDGAKYSAKTVGAGGSDKGAISKTFGSSLDGIVEVWAYDNSTSSNVTWVLRVEDDSADIAAVGVRGATSTTYYSSLDDGVWQAGSVPRSVGWHKFEIDTVNGTIKVDGTQIRSGITVTEIKDVELQAFTAANAVYWDDVDVVSGTFTDDFEAGNLDKWVDVSVGSGTASISTDQNHTTGYLTSGTYESKGLDTGLTSPNWKSVAKTEVLNGQTLTWKYGSNSSDTPPGTWYTSLGSVPSARYFFLRLEFSGDGSATPEAHDFIIEYAAALIYDERGKLVTVLAQISKTDAQSMIETGKQTVILSAMSKTDIQSMVETAKSVTVLTPVTGTDGLLFMETGKTITILAQLAKTEQYTMGETGKITTVLVQLVGTDQATFRDSKVVPVLALTPATDIQSMIETGKSLTVLTPVSGVESYIMGETGKQTIVLISLAESDIQAMKDLDRLETVLVVVIGHDVYIPITPPEGGGIWFDDAWGWRRGG